MSVTIFLVEVCGGANRGKNTVLALRGLGYLRKTPPIKAKKS